MTSTLLDILVTKSSLSSLPSAVVLTPNQYSVLKLKFAQQFFSLSKCGKQKTPRRHVCLKSFALSDACGTRSSGPHVLQYLSSNCCVRSVHVEPKSSFLVSGGLVQHYDVRAGTRHMVECNVRRSCSSGCFYALALGPPGEAPSHATGFTEINNKRYHGLVFIEHKWQDSSSTPPLLWTTPSTCLTRSTSSFSCRSTLASVGKALSPAPSTS